MSFQPALPFGGFAGWTFLKRTQVNQTNLFNNDAIMKRDTAYFREKIGKINTAEELVADQRLLRVALGAFGLDGDIANKAFIRKVLEDGTLKPDALSNRLADKQYQKMAAAFGFGDFSVPRTKLSDFADKLIPQFQARRFESAVGARDDSMRLALNAERELPDLAKKSNSSDDTLWFNVLGNKPLRRIFEVALGIPASLGRLDLDRQVDMFKERAEKQLGSASLKQFKDPAAIDALMRRFHLRAEAASQAQQSSPAASALTLLQSNLFVRL
jgi:hypothetical protein